MTSSSGDDDAPTACPSCGAPVAPAFPGASIVCSCGERSVVGEGRTTAGLTRTARAPLSLRGGRVAEDAGPYRSVSTGGAPERASLCPYCGFECPPLVRICPQCDVRLENVRCQRCYSIQPPGSFACGRCKTALDLEPLLDATDAPCPRCREPLEVGPAGDAPMHECPRCGGMFVPREALVAILTRAEIGGAFAADEPRTTPARRGASALEEVRYLPCPLCHASMNRMNFGKVSGVIVDQCQRDGTWFDAGELTRVVAFAAGGGLSKTRERELAEKRAARKQSAEARAVIVGRDVREARYEDFETWADLLRILLGG